MIWNRYNRISHPAPNTNRESNRRKLRWNKPQQKHPLEWSVINHWGCSNGFTWSQPSPWALLWFTNIYKVFDPHEEGLLNYQCITISNINRFNTEMEHDEYSKAIPSLKRWSKRNPTVESWWADQRQIIKTQPDSADL